MEKTKKVAKKLWEKLGVTKRRYPMQPEEAEKEIVAALREYCKHDLCKDCGCTYENCCCNPVREMKARNAALEEAEKMASEFDGKKCNPPYDWYAVKITIADEIRRLREGK